MLRASFSSPRIQTSTFLRSSFKCTQINQKFFLAKNYLSKQAIIPATKNSHLSSFEEYKKLYDQSIKNPEEFWKKMALEYLYWDKPFDIVKSG